MSGAIPPNPPVGGLWQFFSEAWNEFNAISDIFFRIYFKCSPIIKNRDLSPNSALMNVYSKWFPEKVTFYPTDSHEVMKESLTGLSDKKYKIILDAFNKATNQTLPETTTRKDLIDIHLNEQVTLDLVGHEKLIHTYGLPLSQLKRDLKELPSETRENFKDFIDKDEINMKSLKLLIEAYL